MFWCEFLTRGDDPIWRACFSMGSRKTTILTGVLQCPDRCLKGWAFVWRMLGFEEMLAKWIIGWHCQGLERGCPCWVGTKETSVKTLVPKFRSDGIFGNWWSATFYHVIVSNRLHGTAFGRVNCNWKTEEVGIGPYPDVADAWGREYFLNYRMEEKGWKRKDNGHSTVTAMPMDVLVTHDMKFLAGYGDACSVQGSLFADFSSARPFFLVIILDDTVQSEILRGSHTYQPKSKPGGYFYSKSLILLTPFSDQGLWWYDARSPAYREHFGCTRGLMILHCIELNEWVDAFMFPLLMFSCLRTHGNHARQCFEGNAAIHWRGKAHIFMPCLETNQCRPHSHRDREL